MGWATLSKSMSNDAHDGSTKETLNATETADETVLGEDLLPVEKFEEKEWRDELENRRLTMGDAEETCVFLVEDILAAIFEEMQVRSENASLFSLSARQICVQAFEGVDMSARQASDSLDRIPGLTQLRTTGRQQVLKPQSKWTQSLQSRTCTCTSVASASTPTSLVKAPPPLLFLRHLLLFFETRADRADVELLRFPTSEAISSLSGKRKLLGVGSTSGDSYGEWCISVDQIPAFLHALVSRGLVSAVPSTIAFVMAANHDSLEKKMQMRVALPHIQHFVQKALLIAEEEKNDAPNTLSSRPAPNESKTEPESTPRSRILQTEVPLTKVSFHDTWKGVVGSTDRSKAGSQEELLSSYLEEVPPRAIEMDRRAPRQVSKKAAFSSANPSQRAKSRKILLLLAPPPRQASKWTTLRHKVVAPTASVAKSDGITTITAEADMEIYLAGDRHPPATLSTLGRKATQTTEAGTIAENDNTPDAAALSNIFALGTPRQLSGQELARRNDLLAQLTREAARSQRRATTTVIASMSVGDHAGQRESDGAVCPSHTDHQQFQAYVEANSIVVAGIESAASLSPTRPQQGGALRSRGRANIQRSKFELERDTLPYAVSDGNTHAREEQERLSAAMCSPIKRPRASVVVPTPPLEIPGRPIQTATTLAHLPQLDPSRLAVGVSAVVRGVEKRGPRRNPSRNSRLQLHNYSAAFDGVDNSGTEVTSGGQMLFSPVRTTGSSSLAAPAAVDKQDSCRLPVIPVVSPIKASPHRKHVAFKFQNDSDNARAPAAISPKAQVRQRPSTKVKQPVWESNTRSPPRARNHHFASGRNFCKFQRCEDEESSSATRQKQEEQDSNFFRQPMVASRRSVLPTASEYDED